MYAFDPLWIRENAKHTQTFARNLCFLNILKIHNHSINIIIIMMMMMMIAELY